jgi:serine/threonine protein kinase
MTAGADAVEAFLKAADEAGGGVTGDLSATWEIAREVGVEELCAAYRLPGGASQWRGPLATASLHRLGTTSIIIRMDDLPDIDGFDSVVPNTDTALKLVRQPFWENKSISAATSRYKERYGAIESVTGRIYASGERFVLMQFFEGPTVEDYLRKYEQPGARDLGDPEKTVARANLLIQAVIRALTTAELDSGGEIVAHLDLSPTNVIVVEHDDAGPTDVRLLDFGRNYLLGGRIEGFGALQAAAAFVAPEVRERRESEPPPGRRADVFSMGILLLRALAMSQPRERRSNDYHGETFESEAAPGKVFEAVWRDLPSLARLIEDATAEYARDRLVGARWWFAQRADGAGGVDVVHPLRAWLQDHTKAAGASDGKSPLPGRPVGDRLYDEGEILELLGSAIADPALAGTSLESIEDAGRAQPDDLVIMGRWLTEATKFEIERVKSGGREPVGWVEILTSDRDVSSIVRSASDSDDFVDVSDEGFRRFDSRILPRVNRLIAWFVAFSFVSLTTADLFPSTPILASLFEHLPHAARPPSDDFSWQVLQAHLPGRAVALSFGIIATAYYANIFSWVGIPLNSGERVLMWARWTRIGCATVLYLPILWALWINPNAFLLCAFAGTFLVSANNLAWSGAAQDGVRRFKRKKRAIPGVASRAAELDLLSRSHFGSDSYKQFLKLFTEWWVLMITYSLALGGAGVLYSFGKLHDRAFYAGAICVVNAIKLYRLNCIRDAPEVRAGIQRAVFAVARFGAKREEQIDERRGVFIVPVCARCGSLRPDGEACRECGATTSQLVENARVRRV